jgi:hypothetical protein
VGVHIHEAWQDVHAGHVDLARGTFWAPVLVDRRHGEAHGADLDNAVVLDDDVDRAQRRTAGAIDVRAASEDESLVLAVTLVGAAWGRDLHLRGEITSKYQGGDREDRAKQRMVPLHDASELSLLRPGGRNGA